MYPKICFLGLPDFNQAHVKRGAQDASKKVWIEFRAVFGRKAKLVELISKCGLAVSSGGIKLKCFPYERGAQRVRRLWLSCSIVEVAEWSWHRIKTLLEPSVETLLRFFPEICKGRQGCSASQLNRANMPSDSLL